MSHESENSPFVLPLSLMTRADLRRLIAELESVDNSMITESIHQRTGHPSDSPLAPSDMLDQCAQVNSVDLSDQSSRSNLLNQLRRLDSSSPIVHMTFASTAKQEVLIKLVEWLRQKVHSQALVSIGLQPNLIGGVHIRTTNRVFDMSIRSQLADGRQFIIRELEAISGVN